MNQYINDEWETVQVVSLKRYIVTVSIASALILASFFAGYNAGHDDATPRHAKAAQVQVSSTVLSRPIDYPATSPCAVLSYIDNLDKQSGYGITHAILAAHGQEDTLNVAFENGEECEGK